MESRLYHRWMIRRDMAEVLDIENRAFDFPWREEDFMRCLRQKTCIGMAAEHGEKIVAFMIYSLYKTRLDLNNLAVHFDYRHQQVGRQMIEKLQSKCSPGRRTRLTAEVLETNIDAQFFLRACGMQAVSILRDYYDDSPEDCYVFRWQVGEATRGKRRKAR